MAKEKSPSRGQYGDVVSRLSQIVTSLEGGELSLEESLDRFAEGVTLVKQGEGILADAEKRIEQLLSEEGRTAPLKIAELSEPAAPTPIKTIPRKMVVAPPQADEDDDVPF